MCFGSGSSFFMQNWACEQFVFEFAITLCSPLIKNVRDQKSLERVLATHYDDLGCIWNLAAPLSVETAKDPSHAECVTIGGMDNLIKSIVATGLQQVCGTSLLASFRAVIDVF